MILNMYVSYLSVIYRCDEKGFLSICAFGLAGKSHEDGPSRAVEAALSIAAEMAKIEQVSFKIPGPCSALETCTGSVSLKPLN